MIFNSKLNPHLRLVQLQILMKALLVFGIMALTPALTHAQWTTPNAQGHINTTNTGNVGIGTNAPGATLTVVSNTNGLPLLVTGTNDNAVGLGVGNSSAGSKLWAFYVTGSTNFFGASSGTLVFRQTSDDINAMAFTPTGNVGIGKTSPAYRLDVNGEINATGFRINGTPISTGPSAVTSAFGRIGAVVAATNDYTWAQINKGTSSLGDLTTRSAGDLNAGTVPIGRLGTSGTANSTTFLRGDNTWATVAGGSSQWTSTPGTPGATDISYNSGNVGIGTSTPGTQLHIVRPDVGSAVNVDTYNGTADIRFRRAEGTVANPTGVTINKAIGAITAAGYGTTQFGGFRGVISFNASENWTDSAQGTSISFYNTATGGTIASEKMRIDPSGNVGIGLTVPAFKLHVQGGNVNADGLCIAGDCRTAWSQVGGTGSSQWITSIGTNNISYNTGNVGIGTSTPGYSFDVNGGVNSFRAKAATVSSTDVIATFENASGIQAIVRGNGNVGMGTTNPSQKLEVVGNINVTGTGNITAAGTIEGGNIKAKYQDLAEWVESSQELPAGTVVVVDHTRSNQVIASSQGYDTRVAGVISSQPGITLGEAGENKVLVATTGRVRIKVDASQGPIQVGDLLVTSEIPGVAMKSQPINVGGAQLHRPGTLIGKALEPLAKGSGEILVLLSLQ